MQVTYDGVHSLLIGGLDGIHTWNDWHLIPSSLPIIAPPEVRKSSVEIPGMNGVIDMTDLLLGYPTYGQRNGSLDFYVDHTAPDWDWDTAYSTILNYLHGKKTKLILTDSPSFYYDGRLSVNQYKSDRVCCSITIDYDLAPYRKMVWSTVDQWQWNPFDFQHGVFIDESFFRGILLPDSSVPETGWYTLSNGTAGSEPLIPEIRFYTNGVPDKELTAAAGGMKFVYKINNGPENTLDFFDADTIDEGLARWNFRFLYPDIVVGNPDPNYSFSYKFVNHGRNINDEPIAGQYSFIFTPGRL
jgi:hypothetical protein